MKLSQGHKNIGHDHSPDAHGHVHGVVDPAIFTTEREVSHSLPILFTISGMRQPPSPYGLPLRLPGKSLRSGVLTFTHNILQGCGVKTSFAPLTNPPGCFPPHECVFDYCGSEPVALCRIFVTKNFQ
jgi:hypothetical protein